MSECNVCGIACTPSNDLGACEDCYIELQDTTRMLDAVWCEPYDMHGDDQMPFNAMRPFGHEPLDVPLSWCEPYDLEAGD